jgi:HSP20 family protein
MDNLFQNFLGEDSGNGNQRFAPRVNVAETEDRYEVEVDLPGLSPDDVQVELHENQLTVSGKRTQDHEASGKTYHRVERPYGEFRRVISLPTAVAEERIEARYEHGVLHVVLPKSEKLKPTRIPVSVANN